MRAALFTALLLAFAYLSPCTASAVTVDNWSKLTFDDGQARTRADFAGQTTAIFAFCRG